MIRTCLTILVLATAAFGAPPDIAIVDLGEGRQPRLAMAGDGTVYAVFGRDDGVFCTQSSDRGRSWSTPARVEPITGILALGMRRGPRICVAGDTVVISVIVGAKGGGADGDLVAVRSLDKGKSWSKLFAISDAAGAAREGLHAMTSDGRVRIAAVWLDLRDGQTTVMCAVSNDRGATWQKNVLAYRSPDGHVCECCHPSVTFDALGNIHVMFRNWLKGNRDMYVASSRDSGATWTAATKLGKESWQLNACPMDGGEIGSFDRQIHTVWQRSGNVFVSEPDGTAERKLDLGRQPTLAVTRAGAWLAYLKDKDLWIAPASGESFLLAKDADAPVLSAANERVYCAWQSAGHSFFAALK